MHSSGKITQPMHRVQIRDSEKFREVLRVLVERHPNQREAANQLGVDQATLSRLLSGKTSSQIAFRTFALICASFGKKLGLSGGPTGVIEFAAVPSDKRAIGEVEVARRYHPEDLPEEIQSRVEAARRQLWHQDSERAEENSRLFDRFLESVVTDDDQVILEKYEAWVESEVARLRPACRPVFEELWSRSPCQDLIKSMLTEVGRTGEKPKETDGRCWLALYRAVEPLAAASLAGGVERSLKEMEAADDLAPFLRWSLKRERIMLDREGDIERVRGLGSPGLRAEEMGRFLAPDD